jgi:hypothetical protein
METISQLQSPAVNVIVSAVLASTGIILLLTFFA